MNTIPTPPPFTPSPVTLRKRRRERDDALLDEFDDLVRNASYGDVRAVQALGIALGPSLYAAARELVEADDSAIELLDDFLSGLLDGRAGRFRPKRERALRWLERVLLRFAARRRRGREAERVENGAVDDEGADDDGE
jgi:hypothetical protein